MMLGRDEVEALHGFVAGGPWCAVKDETIRELCRMYLAVLNAPPIRDVTGKHGFVGKVVRIVPELP
jgi:hypothetical protein